MISGFGTSVKVLIYNNENHQSLKDFQSFQGFKDDLIYPSTLLMGRISAERDRDKAQNSQVRGGRRKPGSPRLSLICFIHMTVFLRSPSEGPKKGHFIGA